MTSTAPQTQPKPVQDEFYHQLFRPFLLPEAAAALLGFSAKHVLNLALRGELRGFNVALEVERADAAVADRTPRGMFRIQRRSVELLRTPGIFRGLKAGAFALGDDLLHRRASFSVWEVTHTLDCSDDHVRRLLQTRVLTGPSLSIVSDRQHISRESLLQFLAARELTNA